LENAHVIGEVQRADALGFDDAWIAEHHFSMGYGIMLDVFVDASCVAALTKSIRIGVR
jgi:alkanesulfonate monooxygenase SsuD/methylene tetrahydromethanopterin reductase-like flavin-dependent oxidoreductase (luciferase family)